MEQKNGSKDYIPLNEPAKTALMSIRRHAESAYVLCKTNGETYSFRKGFETAIKKSGILDASFHTLRHSFASHLAMSGVDLYTIQHLMRHKSPELTQRYAHLSKDHKSRAVDVLAWQMDTIWTLTPVPVNDEEFESVVSQLKQVS